MRWYLNPLTVFHVGRGVREIAAGGGPAAVRLQGIGRPSGCIVPASVVALEIVARDGSTTSLEPELPLPLALGWGYRIANQLGLPLISEFDPTRIKTEIAVPGRSR